MALKDEIQKWLSEHPDATVVVGSIGYTIGFLHGNSAKHSEYNEL